MECYFRNFDLCLWHSFSPILRCHGGCSHFGKTFFDAMDFLVSNLLMPFGALYLSLFTGYIFKRLLQWRNSISMKEHGNKDCSKSGSSFFVSSFRHSNHHHCGLHCPIYVIKKNLSSELRPFLFMDG